jgi:hypothetical protein
VGQALAKREMVGSGFIEGTEMKPVFHPMNSIQAKSVPDCGNDHRSRLTQDDNSDHTAITAVSNSREFVPATLTSSELMNSTADLGTSPSHRGPSSSW